MDELNPRQRRFALEYLVDLNGTQAAIRAGYSKKTAAEQSTENLRKPHIRAFLDRALERREARLEIKSAAVLAELARIALADVGSAFDDAGNLLPIKQIPEDTRRAISGVDIEELWEGRGDEREHIGNLRKVKFWNKVASLEALGKHLNLFGEMQLHSIPDDILEAELERRIIARRGAASGPLEEAPKLQ